MAPDILLIANPVSGRGAVLRMAERVRACLRGHRHVVEMARTARRGEARSLAAEAVAAGVATVVACGGDGTQQEVAGALAGSKAVMGILPGGRCNDFARALGFKLSWPAEEWARVISSGPVRRIDLGICGPYVSSPAGAQAAPPSNAAQGAPAQALSAASAERRVFCTVATLGFDSEVTRFVDQHWLPFRGTPAYLYAVLRVLAHWRGPQVRLEGDFGTFAGRILLAATGNTPFYGGAMQIAPGALLDDGLFHVCLIQDLPRLELLRMLPRVFSGRHVNHPAVKLHQTRYLNIETPEAPQWICADGETLGQTPARLEVWPGALQVKAPEERMKDEG